jgi:hypothetical protein
MQYRHKAIPTIYKGIQYRSRLEAKWAAFFDVIGWDFTYEPTDLGGWWPDFKITTDAGTRFLIEVKPVDGIDMELRLKIGRAADYVEGVLIVGESPFGTGDLLNHEQHPKIDYSGIPKEWVPSDPYPKRMVIPNCIGLTSIWGPTKNSFGQDDFEFCVSVVMKRYGNATDIFNLCTVPNDVLDRYDAEPEFCLPIWNEAVNRVQHRKPN